MKNVRAIFARDAKFGIGKDNSMPWPRHDMDMSLFYRFTKDSVVIMGRKTWESIGSVPLPNRVNVVLTTRDTVKGVENDNAFLYNGDMKSCLEKYSVEYPDTHLSVIGGANVYQQALPYCSCVYMTKFLETYDCDTFFDETLISEFTNMVYKRDSVVEFSILTPNLY